MERAFCRPTFAVAVLDTIVIGIVIAAVVAVLWTRRVRGGRLSVMYRFNS